MRKLVFGHKLCVACHWLSLVTDNAYTNQKTQRWGLAGGWYKCSCGAGAVGWSGVDPKPWVWGALPQAGTVSAHPFWTWANRCF